MKYAGESGEFVNWLRVMRVSQGFFFISAMPVLLGVLLIRYHHPELRIDYFTSFLILIGSLLYHLSADMTNEYYDHVNGNDALVDLKTPFNGGTGILEQGLIAPKRVLRMSYIFFALGAIISLWIAYRTNVWVLLFSIFGLVSCWGYTAPPLKLCYRGFGELIIFLNNGLMIIGAIYMAFVGTLTWQLVLPSCMLGFLGMAIIVMNEIPDINADRKVDKKNWVVRAGVGNAVLIHKAAMIAAGACLVGSVILGHLPWLCLIGLASPFTMKDKKVFTLTGVPDRDVEQLTIFCKTTIDLKFRTWGLVLVGLVIHLAF